MTCIPDIGPVAVYLNEDKKVNKSKGSEQGEMYLPDDSP